MGEDMLRIAVLFTCAALACAPLAAQEPKPQYSVKDIQEKYGNCPEATIAMPDGSCQKTRAFGIVRPNDANSQPVPSAGVTDARKQPKVGYRRQSKVSLVGRATSNDLLISFANGSSQLTEQAKANARVFAEALKTPQLSAAKFAIDGHTNAVGSRVFNLELSRARAQAVADFLFLQGVERSRVEVFGHGFDDLAVPASPTSGVNRRVEAHRVP